MEEFHKKKSASISKGISGTDPEKINRKFLDELSTVFLEKLPVVTGGAFGRILRGNSGTIPERTSRWTAGRTSELLDVETFKGNPSFTSG